jgi:Kef-type K+ transport system membrane component KefB
LKKQGEKFSVSSINKIFLFCIFVFFLFLGIGEFADASSLGAILAGVGLRNFLPDERLAGIENEIKAVCYGLFAPIFFVSAGLSVDISFLKSNFLVILLIVVVSALAKYVGSIISAKKELGFKQSILLGTGLLVRFSTSIVIIKILFENNLIGEDLYSTIIATSIVFTVMIPLIFSALINRWKNEIIT